MENTRNHRRMVAQYVLATTDLADILHYMTEDLMLELEDDAVFDAYVYAYKLEAPPRKDRSPDENNI